MKRCRGSIIILWVSINLYKGGPFGSRQRNIISFYSMPQHNIELHVRDCILL